MRNLVLITVDCLRADVGMPELRRLGGLRFTNAISASSSTPPSFSAIFTGHLPSDCGGVLKPWPPKIGVAERLRRHGYHTAGFHSNPWLSKVYGWDKGFDTYKDVTGRGKTYALAKEVEKPVRGWLKKAKQPFFLWVHYMDCHEPYGLAGTPERMEDAKEAYQEAAAVVDTHIARLVGQLPSDTAVIVTADHGQAFMERGRHGHSHSLYEELIHVPLVLIGGGSREEQRTTSSLNISTMLLWEAGVVDDPHPHRLGVAYSQYYNWRDRNKLIVGAEPWLASLRTDKWKLITGGGEWPLKRDKIELYDLGNDPMEAENLWQRMYSG